MRVVSLAPSATETIAAMGQEGVVVAGTSHTDVDVGEVIGDWLTPDIDAIRSHDPELVITNDGLQDGIREQVEAELDCRVLHQEPQTLPEVRECFHEIGREIGTPDAAQQLIETVDERLEGVTQHVAASDNRPVVYCEEWHNPPMVAGNWVPDAVEAAGGSYPFLEAGERSQRVSREAVEQAEPEYAVLHICGQGTDVDSSVIEGRQWSITPDIHVINDSLLNQPSPNLIQGIERLAEIIHGYDAPDRPVDISHA